MAVRAVRDTPLHPRDPAGLGHEGNNWPAISLIDRPPPNRTMAGTRVGG